MMNSLINQIKSKVKSLIEANKCHNPKGSKGGQFCGTGGGKKYKFGVDTKYIKHIISDKGKSKGQLIAVPKYKSDDPDRPDAKFRKQLKLRKLDKPVAPSWEVLWVNPDKKGDMQLKARDGKGVIQPLYRKGHSDKALDSKWKTISKLHLQRDKLMKRIEKDANNGHEPANALNLIAKTGMRAGREDQVAKGVYGCTTLRNKHIVRLDEKKVGNIVEFEFMAKGSARTTNTGKKIDAKPNKYRVDDAQIADDMYTAWSNRKKDPNGKIFDTNYSETYAYAKKISNGKFTPHDFRAWVASDIAHKITNNLAKKDSNLPRSEKEFKKLQLKIAGEAGDAINDIAATTLKSYTHPDVYNKLRKYEDEW